MPRAPPSRSCGGSDPFSKIFTVPSVLYPLPPSDLPPCCTPLRPTRFSNASSGPSPADDAFGAAPNASSAGEGRGAELLDGGRGSLAWANMSAPKTPVGATTPAAAPTTPPAPSESGAIPYFLHTARYIFVGLPANFSFSRFASISSNFPGLCSR